MPGLWERVCMYTLSDICPMTQEENDHIARLAQFITLLYGQYFLQSALSTAAPMNDLRFFYDLREYSAFDREAADEAMLSVKRHLWYLTPANVVLSLFDDGMCDGEKQSIAIALIALRRPQHFQPGKPGEPSFQ